MLPLWRWIKVTSPLTVVTGAIVLSGVTGCRSVGTLPSYSNSYGGREPVQVEPAPTGPTLIVPYDDKPGAKPPILTPAPQTSVQPTETPEGSQFPRATVKTERSQPGGSVITGPDVEGDVFAEPVPPPPADTALPEATTANADSVAPAPADVVTEPASEQPVATTPKVSKEPVSKEPTVVTTTEPVTEPAVPPRRTDEPSEFVPVKPRVNVPEAAAPVVRKPVLKKPSELPPLPEVAKPDDEDESPVPAPVASKAPLLPSESSSISAPEPKVAKPDVPDAETAKIPESAKPVPTTESKTPALDPDPFESSEFFPEKQVEPPKSDSSATKPVAKPSTDPEPTAEQSTNTTAPVNAAPKANTPDPEPAKTTDSTEPKEQANVTLPVVVPGPAAAKTDVQKTAKAPVPERVPQVSARVTKPVESEPTPGLNVPSPGVLTDPVNSLPVGSRITHSDLAEFDQTVDSLVVGEDGSIYVSHRSAITKISSTGKTEVWAKTGSPRGHAILKDGSHIVCDANQRAVLKLDAKGNVVEKLAIKSDGYFLRAPQCVIVDAQGGIYFSDPGYARIRNPIGQVHYIGTDGKVNVVAQKLAFPEGIALSPDGTRLYVVESQKNQILSFELLAPGKVGPKRVLTILSNEFNKSGEGSTSGLKVDTHGRLYVAHRDANRIEVIDPDGRQLTSYHCGNLSVTDVALTGGSRPTIVVGGGRGLEQTRGTVMQLDLPAR